MLTSAFVTALVTGLQQGSDPSYQKIIATSKHWLGYHLESWDGDKQYRLSHSFNYSDTDLQQVKWTSLPTLWMLVLCKGDCMVVMLALVMACVLL